jgi:hypothetical protein
MYRSTWNRWLNQRTVRRPIKREPRRLTLTDLESRDLPSFTAGDLVVYRVGTGTALTTAAAPVFLDDYTTAGALVGANTVALPSSTQTLPNHALTAGGTTNGDGILSTTADGRYLLVTGYNAAAGTASVSGTTPSASANQRVVALVDGSGTVDTTTGLSDATSNIRQATSFDGAAIYTVGATSSTAGGPVRLAEGRVNGTSTGVASALSTTSSALSSLTAVGISGGQLYVDGSVSGLDGLANVGTGLPTTGQLTTVLNGFPVNSLTPYFPAPRQFVFTDPNTVYVADSNQNTGVTNSGGLQKWTLSAGLWTKAYTINMPLTTEGLYSVVADPNNAGTFYGITSEATSTTANNLVKIVDGGSAGASTVTVQATAPTNELFRGVQFAPKVAGTTAITSVGVASSAVGSVPLNTSVTFTATVTAATSPTGYVTFENGGSVLAIVPLTAGGGGTATAQYTTSGLAVGTTTITAVYGGDTTYVGGNGSTSQTVTAGVTTTTTVMSNNSNPAANGQSITFTATVMPASGSLGVGSVTFFDNGASLGSMSVTPSGNNGVAQLTVTTGLLQAAGIMIPGSHTITATYSGVGFVSSTNTTQLIQTVRPNAYGIGDIVIERAGDGINALTAVTGDAVFLDERTTSGALVQSIALPTADNGSSHGLTLGGNVLGDGILKDSADGRYLLATGYDAPVGATITNSQPRVVARIGSTGAVDTSTALTDSGTGTNNIRAAASTDGVGLWAVGSNNNGNLRFTTFGTSGTSTTVNNLSANSATTGLNDATVFNNQLYVTGGFSGIDGVQSVSTSLSGVLPTTTGQTLNNGLGFPTSGTPFPQARQFIFSTFGGANGNPIYVADSRTSVGTQPLPTNGFYGGLQVWLFHFGTYGVAAPAGSAAGTGNVPDYIIYPDGTNNDAGLVGITADFSGANPVIYAVTAQLGGPNKLVKIVDGGSAAASTVTVLATAPTNESFNGIATAPTPAGTTGDTVSVMSSNPSAPLGSQQTFTATISGPNGATINPTGWVTFQKTVGTTTTTLGVVPVTATIAGQAQAVFNDNGSVTNTLGNVTVTAIYGGDSTYVTNTNSTVQMVTGTVTNTTLMSSNATPTASPSVPLTFTATITATGTGNPGSPTGTVTFLDNGLPILNGTAVNLVAGAGNTATATVMINTGLLQTFSSGSVTALNPGIHTITATYTPTGNFAPSPNPGTVLQNVRAQAFGAGDLLVIRIGDSVTPLHITAGDPVYVDEYTTAAAQATPVQSIVMPTKAQGALGSGSLQSLIMTSQQSAEGQLSLSSDGQYVYLVGYDASLGGSADLHTSAAAAIPRTVGRIKYDGTIDTSMALTDLADGGDVRGVASPYNGAVYATGTNGGTVTSNGGVRFVSSYSGTTTTSTQIDTLANGSNGYTGPVPWADLFVSGGQLFATNNTSVGTGATSTNTIKVATIGTGTPTTTGQNATVLAGLPSGVDTTMNTPANYPQLPLGAYFVKLQTGPTVGPDTMYLPDEGYNFFGGAITKWALVSGTWNLVDTIPSNGTTYTDPIPSFDNIAGSVSGTTVNLYATYGNGGNITYGDGNLYSLVDTGGYNAVVPSHTVTTLASIVGTPTGPVGVNFRGVAQVPTAPTTVSSVVASDGIAADGTTQRSEVRQIAVTFSSPVTFAGGNANAAAAFNLSQINDLSTHFASPVAVNNLAAAVSTNGSGQTVVTLTFSTTGNTNAQNTGTVDSISAQNGGAPSLNDGRFQLTILASNVTGANGFALAGGGAGGNYVSPTDTLGGGVGQVRLFRDYGDSDGSGVVDQLDLGQFRAANNSSSTGPTSAAYVAYLDANNDGNIDQIDLGQFRSHNNSTVYV